MFKKFWIAFVGIAFSLLSIWRSLVWLFDWEVRVETVAQKLRDYGGLGGVIEHLINPPPWLALALLPVGLGLIWWDVRRRVLAPSDTAPHKAVLDAKSLQILLGAGDHFESRQSAGLYQTNHTFSVCIENSDPTKFLSNCKLYLNIANEKAGDRKDYWLEGPFTLNPTERKFRSIVSYLEPATVSKLAGDFIQLHVPIGPGYGVGYGWPWRLPVRAYTFSLWAISLETGRREVACKIWVDDNQRLHFEKA